MIKILCWDNKIHAEKKIVGIYLLAKSDAIKALCVQYALNPARRAKAQISVHYLIIPLSN